MPQDPAFKEEVAKVQEEVERDFRENQIDLEVDLHRTPKQEPKELSNQVIEIA